MKKETINVLFISDSLTIGGAEKHVVCLLNNIMARDINLSLAYLKDDATLLPQLDKSRLRNGVFCCYVKRKIDYSAIKNLAKHIEDFDIDIVLCANTYPLLYAWIARLYSGLKPKIIDVLHSTEFRTVKQKLQMFFCRPFYFFTDVLVYVCNNQQTYWRKKLLQAKKDIVIYNGVDVDYFSDRWRQHDKDSFRRKFNFTDKDYVIGLCAAMRPEKAHGDLLAAISMLTSKGSDVKCLLIGDGPERENIERVLKESNLTTYVKITGYLKDVRLAISSCDVMALVSHQIETFSIAALEAMALEKPIIMSDVGGGSEQIRHGVNGYLFNPGDVSAIAGYIEELSNVQLRHEMGKKGREIVTGNFSLDRMAIRYEQLIKSVAGNE